MKITIESRTTLHISPDKWDKIVTRSSHLIQKLRKELELSSSVNNIYAETKYEIDLFKAILGEELGFAGEISSAEFPELLGILLHEFFDDPKKGEATLRKAFFHS